MSDDIEFATPSGDAWEGLHEYLERMDAERFAHAVGAAWSGNALTLDDLNAAVATLKANNVPAFEGYYTVRVYPDRKSVV